MRITEILTESQLEQLEEGPILNKIGSVVGGAARGLAKGVGAVAGGVVGAGRAIAKGYQAGKAFVGDDPDPNKGQPGYDGSAATTSAKSGAAAPAGGAAAPAGGAGGAPSAQDINAAGPKGTAPATAQTGAAGAALAKTTAAVDQQTTAKAGQTVYAQVKANVDKLDKKGKQRILQLLQKSMATPDPKPAAPAGAPAAVAADPAGAAVADPAAAPAAAAPAAASDPGAAAFGQMANTLTKEPTKAAAPAADPAAAPSGAPAAPAADPAAAGGKLTPAQQAAKVAELKGKRAAGKTTGTTGSGFKQYTKDASSQRIVGANKDGSPKIQQIKASKINYGNALSEALAQRVEIHKQKMFETGLSQGTTSIFRK